MKTVRPLRKVKMDLNEDLPVRGDSKKLNGKKIIKVIQAEHALYGGSLYEGEQCMDEGGPCAEPGRCAMGALLFAAGMRNSALNTISQTQFPLSSRAGRLLWKHYGIRQYHASAIIDANDGSVGLEKTKKNIEKRRAVVLKTVDELVKAQRANPEQDLYYVLSDDGAFVDDDGILHS